MHRASGLVAEFRVINLNPRVMHLNHQRDALIGDFE